MSFQVFIPCDILKPFVRSFAISESGQASSYTVLPDTSIVMGFQYSGSLSYKTDTGNMPLSTAGITGLRDTYRIFNHTDHTNTVLVMFSETGAAAFLPQPMHELFGQSIALDDLMLRSQMDVVTEQLHEAKADTERIGIVEQFLIKRLKHQASDAIVNLAVTIIQQHAGNIRIGALATQLFISQSQLEKRFRKTVGASPKKFASIVRLRSIIYTHAPGDTLTQTGLQAGYFDQAHFIKDFKSFTGQTPEQYFGKG
jgi:AraC-like DNA-binding protein